MNAQSVNTIGVVDVLTLFSNTETAHAMATAQQTEFQKNFRLIVEKIFNHWQNLRLAVEHGMGGRNGQQVTSLFH